VIYCIVPRELEAELYQQLVDRYRDEPNVTVVVDRRSRLDRRRTAAAGGKRALRDRRRGRVPGTFLPTDPPPGA
jgi:hypothetical protein